MKISSFFNKKVKIILMLVLSVFIIIFIKSNIEEHETLENTLSINELNDMFYTATKNKKANNYGWVSLGEIYEGKKISITGKLIGIGDEGGHSFVLETNGYRCKIEYLVRIKDEKKYKKKYESLLKTSLGSEVTVNGVIWGGSYYVGNPKLVTYDKNNNILPSNAYCDMSIMFYNEGNSKVKIYINKN